MNKFISKVAIFIILLLLLALMKWAQSTYEDISVWFFFWISFLFLSLFLLPVEDYIYQWLKKGKNND